MECDICARYSSGNPEFHCPACARATVYPHRIEYARLLLEKEQLRKQVEAKVPRQETTKLPDTASSTSEQLRGGEKLQHEANKAETQGSRERVEKVIMKSESLKEKIQEYKQDIEKKKASAEKRQKDIETAESVSTKSRPGVHENLKKTAKRRTHRYDDLYKDVVTARILLCQEAATFAGLRRHQRKGTDGSILESYTLNGLTVIDLRDLNNTSPQRITASLTSISRLLLQACYYLEVRLPAEITLPGENYPLPTIFSPASSFLPQNKDATFPGIVSSTSTSPSTSRTIDPQDQTPPPKPRPLYLDRKLSVLMREDPSQYTHFIEGVSLLAWCIAWLCRTQGLSIANADWEEVCAVGRNLWLLLIDAPNTAQQQLKQQQERKKDGRPKPSRRGTSETTVHANPNQASPPQNPKQPAPRPIEFGTLSHGTAHTPLLRASSPSVPLPPTSATASTVAAGTGAAASTSSATASSVSSSLNQPTTMTDIAPRAWKFASPTSVRDSLKKHLLNEVSAQEWEVLSSGEFDGWLGPASGGAANALSPVDEEPIVVTGGKGEAAIRRGNGEHGERPSTEAGASGSDRDIEHAVRNGGERRRPSAEMAAKGSTVAAGAEGGTETNVAATTDETRPKGSSGWMKLKSRSTG